MTPEQAAQRIRQLTKLLQVDHKLDTQLRRLSLGERMKLELIGAIMHQPEVLFLDEPTIGLDITSKKVIRQFLRDIQQQEGTTLILTSHDMDDIERVCDRVIVVNKGRKVYDDSLASLAAEYKQFRYVRLMSANPLVEFPKYAELTETGIDSQLFKVSTDHLVTFLNWATSSPDLVDMHVESMPLEEMIDDLFKRTGQRRPS